MGPRVVWRESREDSIRTSKSVGMVESMMHRFISFFLLQGFVFVLNSSFLTHFHKAISPPFAPFGSPVSSSLHS
jgi:hypothetical protein